MSQRRACKVVGQPRATQRHVPKLDAEETRLRERLNALSRQRPRAGERTACGQFRQEGLRANPKRAQRPWAGGGAETCRAGSVKSGAWARARTAADGGWGRGPTKCGATIL